MWKKLVIFITRASEYVVNLLMILITADVLLGVFFRYVLGNALSWSEELARYMMIWMGFLAAGLVLREEGHIGIQIIRDKMPLVPRKILLLACDGLVIAFLLFFLVFAWEALQIIKQDISSGLNIRMFWPFLAMPACVVLMIFQQVVLIHTHVTMSEDTQDTPPPEYAP